MSWRVATIDVGTVTARLAVADVTAGCVTGMAKKSTICNLGEGVDKTHRLSPDAMRRVLDCVDNYAKVAYESHADALACTLTSAARDADNSAELLAAFERLGIRPEVIPGQVEGSLTFLGVAQDFLGKRILVADNGGGSTELSVGEIGPNGLDLAYVRSIDVGCRRVTEKFLSREDPPSAESLAEAHAFARTMFGRAVEEAGLARLAPTRLVVTGGTSTTMVAIHKRLDPYDPSQVHLATLSRATVEELEAMLAGRTLEQRAQVVGLQPKRAAVILGGVVAVDELMRTTGFDELTVSESDLLFGMSIVAASELDGTESPIGWQPQLARRG